jgi:predicted acylesterase/phospholipase RssA
MSDSIPNKQAEITPIPLVGNIGLCMSGGGYRAAAFHLGTLAYLQHLDLSSQIKALSTVSGGTFTGAKYVISLVEGQDFKLFFEGYYQSLKMSNLVADGLHELSEQDAQVASGRQDLIVSMAQVYADTLFCKTDAKGNPGEPYYFDTLLNGEQPINELIFNATDFRSGIAFRFQRSDNTQALIGNFYNHIDKEDAAKIRLADIVAASSCFPGGFEPLSFPYDFSWQGGEIPAKVRDDFPFERCNDDSANPQGPVGLMDGGVFDNQGLQSLLMADERSGYNLDLLVISDADQPSLELYEMPNPGNNGGLSLSTIGKLALAFVFLSVTSLFTIGFFAWQEFVAAQLQWEKLVFLYFIPFVLTATAATSVWYVYSAIRDDVLPHIPLIGDRAWASLKRLRIGQVRNMLKLRITSLLALTSSIFMKRIRNLVYGLAYGKDNSEFKGKRVSNLIYTLAPSKTRNALVQGVTKPSELLGQIACVAFNQKTTLWFDQNYQQPCLIAAGQASLCYNMIKLFSRHYGNDPSVYSGDVKIMWDRLEADWVAFNLDPFFMLKEAVTEDWPTIEKSALKVKCNWGMFSGEIPLICVSN